MRRNFFGACLLRLCAFAILSIAAGAASADRSRWTIVDLGGDDWNVTANAVNNRGEVAGVMRINTGPFRHAFVWSNGEFTDLGVPAGSFASNAQGMNHHGTFVGDNGSRPAVFQDGTWTVLPVFGTLNDVNEGNSAVGGMAIGALVHAFIYKDGLITDIGAPPGGSAVAMGINNAGTVVGNAFIPPAIPFTFPQPIRGFVFENGTMSLLETLGGLQAFASDINNAGTIVGTAQDPSGAFHAVVYDGALPRPLGVPGNFSGARAINDRGQIVGSMDGGSFLFDNGVVTRLESIAEVAAAGWTRLQPLAINDRGWIAGTGSKNGVGRSFVLMPK